MTTTTTAAAAAAATMTTIVLQLPKASIRFFFSSFLLPRADLCTYVPCACTTCMSSLMFSWAASCPLSTLPAAHTQKKGKERKREKGGGGGERRRAHEFFSFFLLCELSLASIFFIFFSLSLSNLLREFRASFSVFLYVKKGLRNVTDRLPAFGRWSLLLLEGRLWRSRSSVSSIVIVFFPASRGRRGRRRRCCSFRRSFVGKRHGRLLRHHASSRPELCSKASGALHRTLRGRGPR